MQEDKLSPHERIRLEALAQAVVMSSAGGRLPSAGDVVRRAEVFEDYIIRGTVPR